MTKKKRILLVYPPITKFERYSSNIGSSGGQQIPLGIFYLASFLQTKGYSAKVLDAESENLSYKDIIDCIKTQRFDVLGISTTTVAFHRTLELSEKIKEAIPNITIVVGGPHVSSQPRETLKFAQIDYAIANEGEETLVELLDALSAETSIDKIKGLIYRKGVDIIKNEKCPYIKDIDSIPFPAYDQISDFYKYTPPSNNYKKLPVANIITSRGCPNNCTFCDNNTFGRATRIRSAENIVAEIELLIKKYGIKEIAFVDDTFTVRPNRIYELFKLVKSKGLSFHWTCMARINTVDDNLLRYMKNNGCWNISFGIESGDENILENIHKNIKLKDVENVVGLCHKLKIKTRGFFIVGHPLETIKTINKTINFALKLKLDDIVVTINTPIPGTYQFEHAKEFGNIDTESWTKYNYWNPVFVPYGLSQEILLSKHKEFYRRFYLRPRILWKHFLMCFSQTGLTQIKSLILSSRFLFEK